MFTNRGERSTSFQRSDSTVSPSAVLEGISIALYIDQPFAECGARGRSILPSTSGGTPPTHEGDEPDRLIDDGSPRQPDGGGGRRARDPAERVRPRNRVDELLVQRAGSGETHLGGVLDEDLPADPQHRDDPDDRDDPEQPRHRANEGGTEALRYPGAPADQPAADVVDLDEHSHDPVHADGHEDRDD